MSRVLKFRAWDKTNKKMLNRVLAGPGDPCSIVWIEERREWAQFDDACGEIMEFTGLCDCKGREIYDGDILRIEDATAQVRFWERPPEFGLDFSHNEDAWCEDWNLTDDSERMEIIGNIYEHPNILQPEQNKVGNAIIRSRAIKFRAWYRGAMYSYVEHTTYADGSNGVTMLQRPDGLIFAPDSESDVEFMQFTGLTDAKGRDIYEGDIVKTGHPKTNHVGTPFVGRVYWFEQEFQWWITDDTRDELNGVDYDLTYLNRFQDVEVIGNSYETPDLMKT